MPKTSVWRRRNAASRLSTLAAICEASLAVQGPWMATACRAGMKEGGEEHSEEPPPILDLFGFIARGIWLVGSQLCTVSLYPASRSRGNLSLEGEKKSA